MLSNLKISKISEILKEIETKRSSGKFRMQLLVHFALLVVSLNHPRSFAIRAKPFGNKNNI